MLAEERRIEVCACGVDVVKHERLELRAFAQHCGERAVAEQVRDFVEVPDGVHALEREIVAVVAGLACAFGPADERGAQ